MMEAEPEVLQSFIGAIISGIGALAGFLGSRGGQIARGVGRVAGGAANLAGNVADTINAGHRIVRGAEDFGRSPGELTRRTNEEAYPGTTPWEQLEGGGGAATMGAAEQSARSAQAAAQLQARTAVHVARINGMSQLGIEMVRQGRTYKDIDMAKKLINNAGERKFRKPQERTSSGMAGEDPDSTTSSRNVEAQTGLYQEQRKLAGVQGQAAEQSIASMQAEMNMWMRTTSVAERQATVAEAKADIESGRLELDKERAPSLLYALDQIQKAIASGQLGDIWREVFSGLDKVGQTTLLGLLLGSQIVEAR